MKINCCKITDIAEDSQPRKTGKPGCGQVTGINTKSRAFVIPYLSLSCLSPLHFQLQKPLWDDLKKTRKMKQYR